MNYFRKSLACVAMVGAAALAEATPVVSNVTMTQGSLGRLVRISYNLTEEAVVTLDIQTNATPNAATGWTSIGGLAICNAKGAVWRKVTSADADGQGKYTITWRPDLSWKDENGNGFKIADGCAKAVVTAYALDNTPDYMVVDISAGAQPNTQKYYPSVEFLPGGLLEDPIYRTSTIVMRKIMAKDVTWTMGSTPLESDANRNATREATHQVTLTNNYYIGVFEVTQDQWALIQTSNPLPSYFSKNAAYRSMRPVEFISYNEIRMAANSRTAASGAQEWPGAPYPGSFLGLLRAKSGIDFDLPSDAQWEFAARAGNGNTKWGDGSAIQNGDVDANLALLGRYRYNGGYINDGNNAPNSSCGAENGSAVVGSYAPNDWGLYDMHGNVLEWCLDWFANDITSFGGAVNITLNKEYNMRVRRGGAWSSAAGLCRSAFRWAYAPDNYNGDVGFRLACTAGLQ